MKRLIAGTLLATTVLTTNVFANETVGIRPISAPITSVTTDYVSNGTRLNLNETSTVKVVPDMANIYITVNTEGTTATLAKKLNEDTLKKIKDTLNKGIKLTDKDITTESFNIYPNSVYNEVTRTYDTSGFTANTRLKVTIDNLDNLNSTIDLILENPNTSVSYVTFETSKFDTYYNQALVEAVSKAKERANFLSKALFSGSEAQIKEINSYTSGNTVYYGETDMARSDAKFAPDAVSYVPNLIDITAQAEVVFELN